MKKPIKKERKGGRDSRHADFFFLGIAIIALIFYFWNFTSPDILSDNALYSFRSLGWLDYIGGDLQTTPLQWFGSVPWWANLSFHDAPPLVFAVQHFFFWLFGASVFAARLPFALAGFVTVFVLYSAVARFRREGDALLAALLLAVSSYGIWASRAGYLEGVETLFIGLSFLFFIKYIKSGSRADILWWGVFAGFALLCKYTALFILPAAGAYIVLWKRESLKQAPFWLALALIFALLTPVIVYNLEVYHTRGHFDAALSSMVGMHPEDFKIISGRGISTQYLQSARNIIAAFSGAISKGIFVSLLFSFGYLCLKIFRAKADPLERFVFLNISFAAILFVLSGAGLRFLSVLIPFLLASTAFFFSDVFFFLKDKRIWAGAAWAGAVAIVIVWEALYAANAHLTVAPFSASPLLASSERLENVGFNQLDQYVNEKVYPQLPDMRRPETLDDLKNIKIGASRKDNIVLFDEAIQWFAYTWYLQKYAYYRLPVVSLDNYFHALPKGTDPISYLKQFNLSGAYYFLSVSDRVLDPVKKKDPAMLKLGPAFAKYLEANHYTGEDIPDARGNIAFRAYHITF